MDCNHVKDLILAARCEDREPSPEVVQHLATCDDCRKAKEELQNASPEALAMLVLIRGSAG